LGCRAGQAVMATGLEAVGQIRPAVPVFHFFLSIKENPQKMAKPSKNHRK
jgi:hypothetical protein